MERLLLTVSLVSLGGACPGLLGRLIESTTVAAEECKREVIDEAVVLCTSFRRRPVGGTEARAASKGASATSTLTTTGYRAGQLIEG